MRRLGLMVMVLLIGQEPLGAEESQPAHPRADSIVRLVKSIRFGEFGSKYVRLGDLDGDSLPEILLTQAKAPEGEHKVVITCLTAVNLDGAVIWTYGSPNPANIYFGSDLPVQIYDHDGDGAAEVFFIEDDRNQLTVLEGATGKLLRRWPLAGGHDSLLFADFSGGGHARELVVKDRYTSFWVHGADFQPLWFKRNVNPGHYPINVDLDGDGRDELLCGYTLYNGRGQEFWSHPEYGDLTYHNDAVHIDDMDGDGRAEIAIAASGDSLLLDDRGEVLFREKMDHCQHALIGKFRRDLPGKQVCYINRLNQRPGEPFRMAELTMFTKSGQRLWRDETNFWYMGGLVVDRWTADASENLVGLYSRGFSPPALIDGHGREIALFPFPAAILEHGAGPGGKDRYDDYYMQHLDCHGDEREEIFVFNHRELRVYTNAALWQRPRLYNNTYYPGRL